MKLFLKYLKRVILEILILLLVASLFFALIVTFTGNFNRWWFAGLFLISFLIVAVIRLVITRCLYWKYSVIELVVFVFIFQTLVLLAYPVQSLVPVPLLEKVDIIKDLKEECVLDAEWRLVDTIFGDSLDRNEFEIVGTPLRDNMLDIVREIPLIGNKVFSRRAYVFDRTIYADRCLPTGVLIHELTHIWQSEHMIEEFSGLSSIPYWINYAIVQFTDPSVLYDYGGEEGLILHKKQGKTFSDFGIEQQATIIENLYYLGRGDKTDGDGNVFTPQYQELLVHYVREMLSIE